MKYTSREKNIIKEDFWKVNQDFIDLDFDIKVNPKDLDFFNQSIKLAETSTHNLFKVGAIITSNNKIVVRKTNEEKTHPMQQSYNKKVSGVCKKSRCSSNIHAEMNAIVRAKRINKFDPNNSTIYIGRTAFDKNSTILSSFPCHSCFHAIKDSGIRKIVCFDPFCRIVSFDMRCV